MKIETTAESETTSPAPVVEIERRLAQQALIAEFGRLALRTHDLDLLLAEAARLAAEGLGVRFAKVLEKLPDSADFLMRAGVGWQPGLVGAARVGGDMASPAGYAYRTGEAVISNHLGEEKRFRTPAMMAQHGIHRAVNVIIRGEGEAFGVLEADSRDPGAFSPHDVNFLQALANTLGVAIDKERSRAEVERLNAALAESEGSLKLALEAAELGTWDLDLPSDRLISRSLRHDQMYGYAELQPEWGLEVATRHVVEEDRASLGQAMELAKVSGRLATEFRVRWADGSIHWIAPAGRVFHDAAGRPVRMAGVLADVTDRRQAERALSESEGFLRSLLDASPDCIKVVELDGSLAFMNANGLCAMEIDDISAVCGALWASMWPAEARQQVGSAVAAARAGRPSRFEAFCPTAKGTQRWWDVSVAPIPGPDGTPARIVSISRDVTERVRTERALADSEARFRALAEASPSIVWTAAPSGQVDYLSHAWLRLTGEMPDLDAPGWARFYHPDDLAESQRRLRLAVELGRVYEAEFRLRRSDGQYLWHLSRAVPIRDAAGRIVTWIGTTTDIDAQKRTEAALERALADKDLLTREIDHRVTNSLAMVGGMLRMQQASAASEDTRDALGQAATRLMTIAKIHHALYQSRDVGTVEFGQYVAGLARDMLSSIGRTDADFAVDVDTVELPVDAAIPLGLIAAELMTNALKHARREGQRSTVTIAFRVMDGAMRLTVSDDGPGLPPGFDPGQSKGLGMRLVLMLVRQLGGELRASTVGQGACFDVRLPRPAVRPA